VMDGSVTSFLEGESVLPDSDQDSSTVGAAAEQANMSQMSSACCESSPFHLQKDRYAGKKRPSVCGPSHSVIANRCPDAHA
jgi:hypothetical protein